MAEKSITRYQGVLIPSARFSSATLASKGTGNTESAYTQAGAFTGVPVPSNSTGLILQASGEQSEDGSLEVFAQQGGLAGDGRSGYVWRDTGAGDTGSEYYGQDSPNLITGIDFPFYTVSNSLYHDPVPKPVTLSSGVVIGVLTQIISSGAIKIGTYTPSTGAWTDANFTPDRINNVAGTVYEQHGPAIVQLRAEGVTDRVLMFIGSPSEDNVDSYFSEDDGATWAACGYNVLNTKLSTADIRDMAAAVDEVSGEIVLFVAFVDGTSTNNMAQYVSHDHGASFELVNGDFQTDLLGGTQEPERPDVVALSGGGFIFGYLDNTGSTSTTYAARLLNASDDATALTFVKVAGIGAGSGTITSRGFALLRSGPRVIAYMDQLGGGNDLACYVSEDSGTSWSFMHSTWATTTSGNTVGGYWHSFGVAETSGVVIFLSRWSGSGDTHDPYSTASVYLGGFSRHTGPAAGSVDTGIDTETYDFLAFLGWGDTRGLGGGAYLPIGTPSTMGWTETGAGTGSIVAAGAWQVDTTANTLYETRTWTDASGGDGPLGNGPEAAFFEFGVDIDSGDGSNTTDEISAKIRFSDSDGAFSANFIYELVIRFDSGGYRLWDDVAGAAANAVERAQDLTTHTRIRVALDKSGNVKTWVCVPAHNRQWEEGIASTTALQDDSGTNPGNTNIFEWGHRASTTSTSRWHMAAYNNSALRWGPISDDELGEEWVNPDDLRYREFGSQFETLFDGVSVRALGGPACRADTWKIDAGYSNPVEFAFVADEPSPSRLWRSTGDATQVELVFDLESLTFANNAGESYTENTAIGAFCFGGNMQTFHLDGWDGAAWQTLGTAEADHGMNSLPYTRSGSVVRPGSGTFTADRYLFRNAHNGDTFDLSGSVLRKVGSNTEGSWTNQTTKTPVLRLASPDGSEAASGTGSLWARDFGVVVHDHTETYEFYRIRIPVQDTADDDFRGKFAIGPIVPFGHQHDLGWTVRKQRPYRDVGLRNGRMRRTKEGPVQRVIDLSWSLTAVDASRVYADQTSTVVGDYIVPGETEPGASAHDVVSVMEGLIDELEGAPIVLLRRVEAGSATTKLTIREQFMLARIMTDPTRDNVLGDEVATPLDRLNTVRFVEEV